MKLRLFSSTAVALDTFLSNNAQIDLNFVITLTKILNHFLMQFNAIKIWDIFFFQ